AAAGKVRRAAAIEFAERDSLLAAAALGVPGSNDGFRPRQRRWAAAVIVLKMIYRQLDFPHAVAAVAAVLLEHPRLAGGEPQREFVDHLIHSGVKMRVRAPPEIACAKEDLFRPQLENDIRMRADKNAAGGDIAQHDIEDRSVAPAFDGIDPHEDTVEAHQLLSDLFAKIVVVYR